MLNLMFKIIKKISSKTESKAETECKTEIEIYDLINRIISYHNISKLISLDILRMDMINENLPNSYTYIIKYKNILIKYSSDNTFPTYVIYYIKNKSNDIYTIDNIDEYVNNNDLINIAYCNKYMSIRVKPYIFKLLNEIISKLEYHFEQIIDEFISEVDEEITIV